MAKQIEVELRTFVSQEQYQKLISQFELIYPCVEDTRQITHYFDCTVDTRLQVSTDGGKFCQKMGKVHDEARHESEVLLSREQATGMLPIFKNMGVEVKIAWYRHRRGFKTPEFVVDVDHTVGYGYMVEADIMSDEGEKAEALAKLHAWFKEQGIVVSPREDFEKAFASYKQNWKELTKDLSLDWIDEKVTA